MSIRWNLAGPFRGLPSLEPQPGPSLEPEETSPWESEDELPSLAPADYGSLEGVGSPFRGLPSLAPGPLDVFAVRISASDLPINERISAIAIPIIRRMGMARLADDAISTRLEVARMGRRPLLGKVHLPEKIGFLV